MSRAWRAFVAGPLTTMAIRGGHRLLLLLGATWRVRFFGNEQVDRARLGRGPVLYVSSHGVLLPLAWTHRDRDICVLISRSRDGEIITRVTARLGFGAVRGSTSRGGGQAAAEMCERARAGYDLAITPDGPRGPRGSVAPGVARVAARGDLAIVPVGVASRPAWKARSWDRFLVPPPFARVWVVFGRAVHLPDDADDGAAAAGRVADAMAAAERAAQARADRGGKPPDALRVPA